MPQLHDPVRLDVDACQPVNWNPNQEDVETFNNLVETIEKIGFLDPIIVVEIGDGSHDIIAGEHRWKAAKLAGLKEINAFVVDWDLDEQMIENIRHNVTRGRFDPDRFAKVWTRLKKKYDRDELAKRLGMQHKESEISRLLGKAKASLPKELADELEKSRDEIRNIDDLASVIQSLYARFGSTLDHSYMFLTVGGQVHTIIVLDTESKQKLDSALERLRSQGKDANELIRQAIAEIS